MHGTTFHFLGVAILWAAILPAVTCVAANEQPVPSAAAWPIVVHVEKGDSFENIVVASDGAATIVAGQSETVGSVRHLRVADAPRKALAEAATRLAADPSVAGHRFAMSDAAPAGQTDPSKKADPIYDEFEIARGGASGLVCSGRLDVAPAAVRDFRAAAHTEVSTAPIENSEKPMGALRVRPLREAMREAAGPANAPLDDAKILADVRASGKSVHDLTVEQLAALPVLARAVATPRGVVTALDLSDLRQALAGEREPIVATPSGAFRVQFYPPTK